MRFHRTNPLIATNIYDALSGGDIQQQGCFIPGWSGYSKELTLTDIARKHGVRLDFLQQQLAKGIQVEMEHTANPVIACRIAMDHIFEIPDYYDRLEAMEASYTPGQANRYR